ncbi:MAG: c-type cytochrome [Candidatus Binatus sp.]|uniref:c-type cytochrome n=1 Tax=Candidatus Binatus sp. TaxID=2811406 RepID=UPI00271809F9|nr:c-type cytochrome [Candidatus Binatus sp.]MDO8434976.1 c-type cytochrome [Candidatus Binatus sp.]
MAAIAAARAIASAPQIAACFPWSIDMYRGPEVQPFAVAPRVTPTDTIPVHGGEAPMSIGEATIKMHNPLEPTPQNLAKGHVQFDTYCAPCHGDNGQGKGPVAHLLMKSPKNLITGASKNLPDGYIYGAIRNGVLTMPSYANEMPIEQRWQAVMYLRSMQAAQKNKLAGK